MPKLTTIELGAITDRVAQQATAHAIRLTGDEWRAGCEWYGDAHSQAMALAVESGSTVETASAVIAALSPRLRWEWNVQDAHRALVLGDRYSGFRALGASILKAGRIADGGDPETVLGGRKVRSFYRNILHPTTSLDVTIDVWFLRHVVPRDYLDHYSQWAHFTERLGVYDAVADAIRRVADGFGVLPSQLQAALWIQARARAGK